MPHHNSDWGHLAPPWRGHFGLTQPDQGGAEGDLMELAGWTSRQMLTRYGASARSARARRSYDRIELGDRSIARSLAGRLVLDRVVAGDELIVEVAKSNPTDGTRMVAALATRELGMPVNRKRVQRVMRQHRLVQRSRNTDRRRRPGYFRVTRPDELWHLDMTRVWTAAHGWVYVHVAVDCCTREVACWRVDLRTRSEVAIACIEHGILDQAVPPGRLTRGSDNGSQFTIRDFRRHRSARGVTHRRGGYRDPESQAFIESWFGQFKKRCAWRAGWETIDQARKEIADYIDRYHHRPHSGIGYRRPREVGAN